MKIQNRGLSLKLANSSCARGRGWLCHWVNGDACPESLEGFRESHEGERGSTEDQGEFLELCVALYKPPNWQSGTQWRVQCREKNNKTNTFSS